MHGCERSRHLGKEPARIREREGAHTPQVSVQVAEGGVLEEQIDVLLPAEGSDKPRDPWMLEMAQHHDLAPHRVLITKLAQQLPAEHLGSVLRPAHSGRSALHMLAVAHRRKGARAQVSPKDELLEDNRWQQLWRRREVLFDVRGRRRVRCEALGRRGDPLHVLEHHPDGWVRRRACQRACRRACRRCSCRRQCRWSGSER